MAATIRPERLGDENAIGEVTRQAFASRSYSTHTEHFIVQALRKAGALALSLVAEQDGRVVGHIAFSPVTIADGSPGWYGLGPVSVVPALQGQGIGRALIERGLEQLRGLGARGCVLLGKPSFYARFGFMHNPDLVLAEVPRELFLALCFDSTSSARGAVTYHAAFSARG